MTGKENEQAMEKPVDAATPDQSALARRRMLRLASYVPPAILGMAIIGGIPGAASAGNVSCNPTDNACNPNGGPCNPSNCNPNTTPNIGSCMPSACRPCMNTHNDDKYDGTHPHDDDVDQCRIEKARKAYEDSHK